jgi:5-formyltetrahydrofolate cyclo-ligase
MSDKVKLRQRFRELRNQVPGHEDYLFLLDVPEVSNAKVITSYYPMQGEPSLITLNNQLVAQGKTLLLPRIVNKLMEFAKYEGSLVQRGAFNEPPGNIFIGEINVVLVPATAIDHKGNRLGQGGGYYDRFLVTTPAYRIGIIHEREFLKKELPTEWFDQRVDAVATEKGLVRFS